MNTAAPGAPASRRDLDALAVPLLLAAMAWAGTVVVARRMGVMPGTMGLAAPAFLGIWLLMMAAMMLPAARAVVALRRLPGSARDLRVGAHHGLYCLGCCWALFAALIVLGMMNLLAMVSLAVVVAAEKLWAHGVALSRVMAIVAVALAVAVAVHPLVAAGLYAGPMGAAM